MIRSNGSKPRYRGNRLIFLAPDHGALTRLRDALEVALAWNSIVEDVKDVRLNIDQLQRRQAEKEWQTAEEVVPRAARECYRWLLCPVQHTPTDPRPEVEVFPLNTGSAALGGEVQRVCQDNEWVIETWSPIHLRAKLHEVYWKADRPAVGALAFWEDTLRYLYLPRLKNRSVLEQAIIKGAGSRDFFGTAYGQHTGSFDGFKLGDANVQIDDTLLLIEPTVAQQYEAAQAAPPSPPDLELIDQELRAKRCDLLPDHTHDFPGQGSGRRDHTGELRWAFHSIEREQCARLAAEIPAQIPEPPM